MEVDLIVFPFIELLLSLSITGNPVISSTVNAHSFHTFMCCYQLSRIHIFLVYSTYLRDRVAHHSHSNSHSAYGQCAVIATATLPVYLLQHVTYESLFLQVGESEKCHL